MHISPQVSRSSVLYHSPSSWRVVSFGDSNVFFVLYSARCYVQYKENIIVFFILFSTVICGSMGV